VLYGAGRFLLELLRTDTTFRLFGLSRNAYVSLVVVVGGSVWLFLRERGGRSAAEPQPQPQPGSEPAAPADAAPAEGPTAGAEDRAGAAKGEEDQDREDAPAGGRDEPGGRAGS
jgi:hypothetical protein